MSIVSPDQAANGGRTGSLAEYIRARRVELDLTKAEAARRAGVSRRTWTEVEAGDRTTSTAVTLAQFDQALQLPEGTLWRMTASSTLQAADDLRRRAVALVRSMSYSELEYFVAKHGADSLYAKVDEMSDKLDHIAATYERLLREGLAGDDSIPERPVGRAGPIARTGADH